MAISKQYFKEYYLRHREEKIQYAKKYRPMHREEISQYRKAYYQIHKKEIKEQNKKNYLTHREQRDRYTRKYMRKHPELQSRHDAKKRGLGFNILYPNIINEPVDYHHINNTDVVAIPRCFHRATMYMSLSRHRFMMNQIIKQIYGVVN